LVALTGCLAGVTATAITRTVHPLPGMGDYQTIKAAVDDAQPNDLIDILHVGPYSEQPVTVNETLTIQGPEGSHARWLFADSSTACSIGADNITLRRLQFEAQSGNPSNGTIAVKDGWVTEYSDIRVEDCVFDTVYEGVSLYAENVTVSNCEFNCVGSKGVTLSSGDGFLVTHCWFHDWASQKSSDPGASHGIHVKHLPRGDITYNYFEEVRTAIRFTYNFGGTHPGPNLIAHNTFAQTSTVAKVRQYYSIEARASDTWDGNNVAIRDNIFYQAVYRIRWYGTNITAAFQVKNNLFYHNNAGKATSGFPHLWYGDHNPANWGPQLIWEADADDFVFSNNRSDDTSDDPKFAKSGLRPEEYWALQAGSPALDNASDGTNIGAWQGDPGGGGPGPQPGPTGAVFRFK